ncbi:hypothetical protein [Paenibacillus sp. PK1-4R]|uniref:hypothetical protein n=1 Tax=Paenibacillus sp. PK1-4R TaxID=3049075 RepID=UPI0025A08F76|nr:hypothetical protein [Paenibacillus sp. PK1-4R]WJM09794.1 hypothetical protein QNO02_07675 [Paenibacillus sp. PK1-4R]
MANAEKTKEIIEIAPEVTIDQGFVKLPINHDALRGFVSSLLGRPQVVENVFKGSFSVEISNIINIHHVLTQRVRQNPSELLDFRATITFEDDSSIKLGSFEELRTYNSTQPLVITRLNVYWSFLVHFPDKKSPEKQETEMVFISDQTILNKNIDRIYSLSEVGAIKFVIGYTDRTWGNDIQNLLSNQVKVLLEDERSFYKTIKKNQNRITLLSSISLFLIVLFGCIYTVNSYSEYSVNKINNIIIGTNDINIKLNYISEYIASGDWQQFNLYAIILLIGGVFLSILAGFLFDGILGKMTLHEAFICLNEHTKKYKAKSKKKSRNSIIKFIASFVFSVFCGVIGNVVFQVLIN